MKKILVFCGSNHGNKEIYARQAALLGGVLAHRGIELIYGGAKVGLMGKLADAVIQEGGRVTGVLPQFLKAREIAHPGLTSLLLVDTLQERKTKIQSKLVQCISLYMIQKEKIHYHIMTIFL